MDQATPKTIAYRRSRFSTQLPVDYLYSPSHAWLAREGDTDVWRVGLTKFATRMLGEMVDHGFESDSPCAVQCGQIIGWVEGFKAISDLFCVVAGNFLGGNAELKQRITLVNKDPYQRGWLYRVEGRPDPKCMDVTAYVTLLDQAIDRILEKQQAEGEN